MKNLISPNQGTGSCSTSQQINIPNTSLNAGEDLKSDCTCVVSSILVGDSIILVPRPIRANDPHWVQYNRTRGQSKGIPAASDSRGGEAKEPRMSKEERAGKVRRFLEKRRRRNGAKKIRYQYRQQVAARRIRYHGRFIKLEQAKELILRGELVDANDKTELNKLFEELKESCAVDDVAQSLSSKQEAKNSQDTIFIGNINKRKFSSSTSGGTNSRTSPLIQVMREGNISPEIKQLCTDLERTPPELNL